MVFGSTKNVQAIMRRPNTTSCDTTWLLTNHALPGARMPPIPGSVPCALGKLPSAESWTRPATSDEAVRHCAFGPQKRKTLLGPRSSRKFVVLSNVKAPPATSKRPMGVGVPMLDDAGKGIINKEIDRQSAVNRARNRLPIAVSIVAVIDLREDAAGLISL